MSEINFSDSDGLLDRIATALREGTNPRFQRPRFVRCAGASGRRNPDRTFSPRPAGMEPQIWRHGWQLGQRSRRSRR